MQYYSEKMYTNKYYIKYTNIIFNKSIPIHACFCSAYLYIHKKGLGIKFLKCISIIWSVCVYVCVYGGNMLPFQYFFYIVKIFNNDDIIP